MIEAHHGGRVHGKRMSAVSDDDLVRMYRNGDAEAFDTLFDRHYAAVYNFARTMLGLHAHDTTAGFRCYRREVLEGLDLDEIKASGYSFLIEMLYRVQRRGWQVGEVPIIFENRRLGTSKISRDEIIKAMGTVLRLAWARMMGKPA